MGRRARRECARHGANGDGDATVDRKGHPCGGDETAPFCSASKFTDQIFLRKTQNFFSAVSMLLPKTKKR